MYLPLFMLPSFSLLVREIKDLKSYSVTYSLLSPGNRAAGSEPQPTDMHN